MDKASITDEVSAEGKKLISQRREALYSWITWHAETRQVIEREIEESLAPYRGLLDWRVHDRSGNTLQVDILSAEIILLPDGSEVREQPAHLVYSMHPNGSLILLLYPHASDSASVSGPFIVDLLQSARCLGGRAGSALIRRHARMALKLSLFSSVIWFPQRSSGRFIRKLQRLHDRYQRVFRDDEERRKNKVLHDVSLGVGLAGGLIASTLFPLAAEIGQSLPAKDHVLKGFLSPFSLFSSALLLLIIVILFVKRNLDR